MLTSDAPDDSETLASLDFDGLTGEEILELLSGTALFGLAMGYQSHTSEQMLSLWNAYKNLEHFWEIVMSIGEGGTMQ